MKQAPGTPDQARWARWIRAALLAQILGFAFFIAGTHGAFVPLKGPPTTTDFASFYAAGRLADEGRAASAYDYATLLQTGRERAPGVSFNPFLNPPPFLLVCSLLARLPYLLAFILFECLTGAVFLSFATRIAGGGGLAAMALAAIPSVWWAAGWGQNSFLSAGVMAAGTLVLPGAPLLAGACLGTLIFKPHWGILLPVAFLAGRQWRALCGATLGVLGTAGLTLLCFGPGPWSAFLAFWRHGRETIESGKILFAGHVDVAGALRLLGAAAGPAWVAQALVSLAAACCVGWIWARPNRHDIRCAALVAGTLVAMPFVLFYDLVMAGVAGAWLAHAARETGWPAGVPRLLLLAAVIDLLAYPLASAAHLPVGVLVAPSLLLAVVQTARRSQKYQAHP